MAVIDIIIVVIVKNGGITTTIEVVDTTVVGLIVTEVMKGVVIEVVIEVVRGLCGRHRRGGPGAKIELPVGLTNLDPISDAIRLQH